MIALSSRFPRAPLLGILAIAVLSACGSEEAADSNDQGTDRAVAVTLAEAGQQEVRVELYSVGRLISLNTPLLAAEVDARVVEVLVDEGEPIVQGQELLRLDTTALELSLIIANRSLFAATGG